jgi:hypothetical protein
MSISSSGTPEPVPFISNFEENLNTDAYEVTAYLDTNKTYVQGFPDRAGTYSGFYDDSTSQMYAAAIDGLARDFYFYPTESDLNYIYGSAFWDTSRTTPVDGAIAITGNWRASGNITTYPPLS